MHAGAEEDVKVLTNIYFGYLEPIVYTIVLTNQECRMSSISKAGENGTNQELINSVLSIPASRKRLKSVPFFMSLRCIGTTARRPVV